MVLTDREIRISIEQGQIVIDPVPAPEAFSSTSVDLTLSSRIRQWKPAVGGVRQTLDPSDPAYNTKLIIEQLTDGLTIAPTGHTIEPGQFLLAWSEETIEIPVQSRLAARVEGKSSMARIGVGIHVTAPTIHAGFTGQIQLEMFNIGPNKILLVPGMKICQLIFETTLGVASAGYQGQFSGQHSDV